MSARRRIMLIAAIMDLPRPHLAAVPSMFLPAAPVKRPAVPEPARPSGERHRIAIGPGCVQEGRHGHGLDHAGSCKRVRCDLTSRSAGVLARPTTRCGTDRIKCGTGVPNLERAS